MSEGIEHYHRGYGFWIFKSQVIDLLNMALKGSISADMNEKLQSIQSRFIPAIDCLRFCFTQFTAPTLDYFYFPDKKKSCKLVPIQLLDCASDRLIKLIYQRIRQKRVSKKIEIDNESLQELLSLLDSSLIEKILVPIGKRLKQAKDPQEASTLQVLNEYFIKLMIELSTYFHSLPKWVA